MISEIIGMVKNPTVLLLFLFLQSRIQNLDFQKITVGDLIHILVCFDDNSTNI